MRAGRMRKCFAGFFSTSGYGLDWTRTVLLWLTVWTLCHLSKGNLITRGTSVESLERNWYKDDFNDLSGDGGLEDPRSSAKWHIETTVPVIYSSFSTPLPRHHSSFIDHPSSEASLTEVSEMVSSPPEVQSSLTTEYSVDVSTSESDVEDCSMSHPSLPYSGPSSLLNTFIFRPSLSVPSPTPTWSSAQSFASSSGLRERSWWEYEEIPIASHEAHLSTPLLPSSINLKSSSSCISSCDTFIRSLTGPSILPVTSPFFTLPRIDISTPFLPASSKEDSSLDSHSHFCSSCLFPSLTALSTETTVLTTDKSGDRTTRLPVFITDQFITSGSTSTDNNDNIESTYHGIFSPSVLSTTPSTSDLNIIHSASFYLLSTSNTDFTSTDVYTDTRATISIYSSSVDTMPSTIDIFSTQTNVSGLFSPVFTPTEDDYKDPSLFWTSERAFSTNDATDMSISFSSESSPLLHEPYVSSKDVYSSASGTASYDVTTEGSTRSTRPPSTESSTLDDVRYWVKTVVKAEPSILPINFLQIAKGRLQRIYNLAFSRRASRQRRDTSQMSSAKIQFTKYTADWRNHQVELVYTVEYLGEPILATKAVDTLEEVDNKEFAKMMDFMVIVKAEVYVNKSEVSKQERPWIMYAVVGIVGGLLIILICIVALYFRYCYVREEKLDTESVRLKMFGEKNKKQAFQEEIKRSQKEIKSGTEVDRPLPLLPFHPVRKSTESSHVTERTAKRSKRKKRSTVSTETQTDGYYNKAYESDTTEPSLTSVTSTQTSSNRSSQDELLKSPTGLGREPKPPLKVPLKSKWPNSKPLTSERPDSPRFESAKTSLLAKSNDAELGKTLSDTDAGIAEAEIEVGRMRRRITELFDDAFSYGGPKLMYSSLRTKQILPTSGAFHRWTSLRSPNRHELLNDTFNEAKSAESLPDVDPMKARHEPLFINLPPHKQPPVKPRVVWSIYKAGDEVSELSDEMQAKACQHEATSYAPPTKLFEHRVVPPSTAMVQQRPPSPMSLIHPSFRPFSAPSIVNVSDTLRPPYTIEVRSTSYQPKPSSVPLLDTLQESPLSQHQTKQHCEKDEIDTATELKFRQPAQSVIEAIRDELNKFNTSLPKDNRESFA